MPQWKMGDLRTKKVPKRKGDLLPMRGDSVLELDHNADVWEVQKLVVYAGSPKWKTAYFSLEDPNKVWDEGKRLMAVRARIEAEAIRAEAEKRNKRAHKRELRLAVKWADKKAKQQELEREQYHRWYRRAWRAISKPALPKAKVEKE